MSVFVSIEDDEGEALAEVFELERLQGRFASVAGCCLRFVSDRVDASFNALQTPLLVAELESLRSLGLDAIEKAELERLAKLCAKHAGKPKTNVRFYGEAKASE